MNSDQKHRMHPAFRPSDSSVRGLANDPLKNELPELSTSELMAFLEDFPGQLATVTPINVVSPRRFDRLIKAIGRGFGYCIHSLEDYSDIYDR